MEKIIEVKNLVTKFNERIILDNVSIDVQQNEIMVILGSSGCGKTTLLKHIIRLYYPVSGSIRVFGEEITQMDEAEFNEVVKKFGVLFQNGALLNSLTIGDNISIPLQQHTDLPASVIERIVRMKLHLVELDDAYDLLPSELSGGMRKRAALARAMAMDPPILFCDEPSAGLDPVTSASLDELILKLKSLLGMTIVVVTHELASIHRIANRLIFLYDGKVLFLGTLEAAKASGIPQVQDFFSKGKF